MENLEAKTEKLSKWPIYDIYQIFKDKNRKFLAKEVVYHGGINGVIVGLPLGYILIQIFK